MVIWDYANAYNTVRTYSDYESVNECMEGVCKIYEDRVAATGLEVSKRKVADVREAIDPAAAKMIKKGYSDDGVGGGTKQDVA